MTVEQLIQEIRDEIEETNVSSTRILRLLNRGCEEAAMGRFNGIPEYSIDSLETSGDLTTSTSLSYIALSGLEDGGNNGYQKNLFHVYSDTRDSRVEVVGSLDILTSKDHALDGTGTIYWVCISGDYLYYQNIPSTADTLTLRYFSKPDVLDFGGSPSFLPSHLQAPILVSYALKEMFRKKGKDKERAAFYENAYLLAIQKLSLHEGIRVIEPKRITDTARRYFY